MTFQQSRRATRAALAALVVLVSRGSAARAQVSAARAADSSFAGLVQSLSEAGGYFDSDNIITNELSYLQVSSQLAKVHVHGGLYLGVGPDQNFSYIALIKPSMAFMIDIRRDNMLEHLLFKSLFMMARNRLEYICLLLGKPVPANIDQWTGRPVGELLAYIGRTPVDSATFLAARAASNDRITQFHLPLDARDREVIDAYRSEFVNEGLDTRYSSLGRNNRNDYPSFGGLIVATDRAGRTIGYLADENAFQFVRRMELENRIVPVVGNVAGDRAMKAVTQYAISHRLNVSAFYLSNVEQYLMGRDGGFDAYAHNVAMLPHDSTSVIIRSYFGGRFGANQHPLYVPALGNLSTSLVERMDSFNRAYAAGEIGSYLALVSSRYVTP
jgi:hypothetical protein